MTTFVCSEPGVSVIPSEGISALIERAQAKLADGAAASGCTGAVTLLPVVRDVGERLRSLLDLISDFVENDGTCPFRGGEGEVDTEFRGGELRWTCPLCCTQHVDGPDDGD
jgi:hypothetical protein